MNISKKIALCTTAVVCGTLVVAAVFFDPRFQPIGSASTYVLSKPGLADGQAKLFRPYFDDSNWWGDLQSYNVDDTGAIATVANWSARALLDARSYTSRKIFTRRLDGTAVMFDYASLSAEQRSALRNQNLLDFIHGDTSNEGGAFRNRVTVLGDIINSSAVYIEYDEATLSENRLAVGANDGMLHVFNAATGVEEMAYIPSEVIGNLALLADWAYFDSHRYYVDGQITVRQIILDDGSTRRVLVGGLGAGGQAFYALNMTDNDNLTDMDLTDRLLWEISDDSPGMADLGFSYSRPLITRVKAPDDDSRWAVIFSNGYGNTLPDSAVGSGSAVLFVVDLYTGELIRKIDTYSGDADDPNGASSPSAIDLNVDGIVDYVYAGDLDGHVWRFDLTSDNPAQWGVSFGGSPFFTAINSQDLVQAITIPPRVLRHPDGGLLVLVGTGRTLSAVDADPTVDQVYSIYGLRDRLDGDRPDMDNLVIQDLTETTYNNALVRTSSNFSIDSETNDGWLVDLISGERILTALQIRSGRVVFSSTNPTIIDGEIWVNEINYLTGGAPTVIIYDMDANGDLDFDDNIDGNGDGDTYDVEDRITGLYQGQGLVVSSPMLATLSATSGTYFVNRIDASTLPVVTFDDPGIIGGHFDVDTTSYISAIGTGDTDAHIHEYDDKHDVKGVDYFQFLDDKLHNIDEDVDGDQRFKILVVNADRSPGGRLSVNYIYDENDPFSYWRVTDYDGIPHELLDVFTLSGLDGTTHLTELGLHFDRNAILDKGLIPTKTGCVRSNTLSTNGEWRNGALTIWAVAVDEDGYDAFSLTYDADDPSKIVGIEDGLLFESTLFWHWKGPCAHEYDSLDDLVDPDDAESETVWEKYFILTLKETKGKVKKEDKGKKKDKKKKGGDDDPEETTEVVAEAEVEAPSMLTTTSPVGNLSNPNRTSWTEFK